MKKKKHAKMKSFIRIRAEMLQSPAFRALSLTAHRILHRLLIELCQHGGKDNGKLVVTYDQFESYGIHRHAIGPGLRELEILVFIQIVERGIAGNAEFRRAHKFRITFLPTEDGHNTDEWSRINEKAEMLAAKARATKPKGYPRRRRKRANSQWRKMPKPMAETTIGKPPFSMAETATENPKSPMPDSDTTI